MNADPPTVLPADFPPDDWLRTPPSVQAWLRRLLPRLAVLEQEVVALRAENAALREQMARSSRNSSQPPSQDGPGAPRRPPREPSGKKRGGQPGHARHERRLYPVEQCARVTDHRPDHCGACGQALAGNDPQPWRHQVVEVPAIPPQVDEYRLHRLLCPVCGEATRAPLPAGVSASGYGPRLVAVVGLLSGAYRQSERQVQQVLSDLYGIDVALGTIDALRQEASQALADSVDEAWAYAQAQPVAHADETGWRQGDADGGNPEQRKAWLWVLVTPWVTVFQIYLGRGQAAAAALLGSFAGWLVTDRWSGYGRCPWARRQLCWAHLIREFQKIAERGGASQPIGEGLLEQARRLFAGWGRVRDGTLARAAWAADVETIRAEMRRWLIIAADHKPAPGDQSPWAKTVRTCRALLQVEEAFWRFVAVDGLEPTNNAAERALRGAVIWRRTSLGTQSAAGSRFVARMLTAVMTLRAQGRNVLTYLTAACAAARQGLPAPSLLPDPSRLAQDHRLATAA
jgi:hypothetical protein